MMMSASRTALRLLLVVRTLYFTLISSSLLCLTSVQIILLGADDPEPIRPLTSASPIFPAPRMAIFFLFNITVALLISNPGEPELKILNRYKIGKISQYNFFAIKYTKITTGGLSFFRGCARKKWPPRGSRHVDYLI